jgi:hypothetical protein
MAGAVLDWLGSGIRPVDEMRTPVSLVARASSVGVI